MMTRTALLVALLFPFVPSNAQDSSTARACVPIAADTARFGSTPVFATCEVERPVKLRRAPRPRVEFPDGVRCLTADVEFVVDEQGAPIVATAALLGATTTEFGRAALRSVKDWQYVPAMHGGAPVRQLVIGRLAIKDQRVPFVASPRGQRPPPRPSEPRCE